MCISHTILLFPNLPWLPVAFRIKSVWFSLAFTSISYPDPWAHCPVELTLSSTQEPLSLCIWAESCLRILAHVQVLSNLKCLGQTCPSFMISCVAYVISFQIGWGTSQSKDYLLDFCISLSLPHNTPSVLAQSLAHKRDPINICWKTLENESV